MKQLKLTGPELKTQMIRNGKSLSRSAKELNITVEELTSYFEYDVIKEDMLFDILKKLKIWIVIDAEPYEITPLAIKQFGIYEERIKLLEIIINGLMDYVNEIKNFTEKYNNATRNTLKVLEGMLKIENQELFDKVNEELTNCDVALKESFNAFNERYKVFKK